jgi:hypothetical protein
MISQRTQTHIGQGLYAKQGRGVEGNLGFGWLEALEGSRSEEAVTYQAEGDGNAGNELATEGYITAQEGYEAA